MHIVLLLTELSFISQIDKTDKSQSELHHRSWSNHYLLCGLLNSDSGRQSNVSNYLVQPGPLVACHWLLSVLRHHRGKDV